MSGMWLLTLSLLAAVSCPLVTASLTCSKEWLLKQGSCYRWGPSQMPFQQAKSLCNTWGSHLRVITNDKENEVFRAGGQGHSRKGELYWLGIEKKGLTWKMEQNGTDVVVTYNHHSRSFFGFGHGGDRNCMLWDSSNLKWIPADCISSPHLFICQKAPASKCPPGRFGNDCARKCQCKGQKPCDMYTGLCARGCQLGWSGSTCGIEKRKAEAKFYCFKIRKQNTLMLRVNQRGTRYRTVTAYNKDGTESPGCNKTHFNHFEIGGMATLKVIQKHGVFQPSCGENQEKDEVVTWRFKFREFPAMSSFADVLFEVTCHFKTAESLTRLETSAIDIPPTRRVKVEESKVSVSFNIVDPSTEGPLTKVKLGSEVKLQMKLNRKDGDDLGVSGIWPYNCAVSTSDGIHRMVFKDENGCMPNGSRILFNPSESNRVHSATFEAFTFPNHHKVNFRCSYRVCFSGETDCQGICSPSKKQKKKTGHVKGNKNKFLKNNVDVIREAGAHLGLFI